MTPYHADDWLTIDVGDCLAVLATMPAESVNCVVTSPPYYGLRDYGTASWDGGDPDCDDGPTPEQVQRAVMGASGLGERHGSQEEAARSRMTPRGSCGRCGATRIDSQLGLEPTPDAYIAALVAVFREVRRVLRKDGTVWLNLGDSYASAKGHAPMAAETLAGGLRGVGDDTSHRGRPAAEGSRLDARDFGMKGKDRMMIPARVAIALQSDGWWLRDEIVWAKPNPMPSSVTDRTTPAHEMVYLLTRSARYAYDADAVREPISESTLDRWHGIPERIRPNGLPTYAFTGGQQTAGVNPAGRNKRSVWTVATQPYPEAHFATFPEALIEPMILAGCPERVCADCGAPWERVVERGEPRPVRGEYLGPIEDGAKLDGRAGFHNAKANMVRTTEGWSYLKRDHTTTGWRPTCAHDADTRPGVVLDPFAGSGTTGMVAQRLNRRAVLIDLSADYVRQMMARNRDIPMGLGA